MGRACIDHTGERMGSGGLCGLQNRHRARVPRPRWVRFPHVPAIVAVGLLEGPGTDGIGLGLYHGRWFPILQS